MVSTRPEYYARKAAMIEHLGGVCVVCGSTEDLQFDHIDPATKKFVITSGWSRCWDVLLVELAKCQLLCPPHHKEKSKRNGEHTGGWNRWTEIKHGTIWAYSKYKCRCDECKAVKAAEYQNRKKRDVGELGTPHHLG